MYDGSFEGNEKNSELHPPVTDSISIFRFFARIRYLYERVSLVKMRKYFIQKFDIFIDVMLKLLHNVVLHYIEEKKKSSSCRRYYEFFPRLLESPDRSWESFFV